MMPIVRKKSRSAAGTVPPPTGRPAVAALASPGNLACRWTPAPHGGGALTLVYRGPLAVREHVAVRFGLTRAGGRAWSDTRELRLHREDAVGWVATLDVQAGPPVVAVEFALRAGDAWDNGGRAPFGYYEWRLADEAVVVVA